MRKRKAKVETLKKNSYTFYINGKKVIILAETINEAQKQYLKLKDKK